MTSREMMIYDQIVELGIATAEELNLARNLMCGEWKHVFDSVVYIRTGARTFDEYYQELMEEE